MAKDGQSSMDVAFRNMIGHEEEQGAERAVEQGWHGQGGEESVWGTKNNFDALQHGRVEPAGGGLVAGGEGLGASSRVATEWPTPTGGTDLARGPDSTYLIVDQGRTGPSGGRLALRGPRQRVVGHWTLSAFGAERALNLPHRGLRHLEESLELAQAVGVDKNQAHALIEHIWSKAPGDIAQEVGGSGLTLLALAEAAGLDADAAEIAEVERVLEKELEHFRRRNEEKDAAGFGTSFPACAPSAADLNATAEEERLRRATEAGKPDELKPLVDEMMQSTDAMKWASVFVTHVLRDPSIATDEATMLGWFANAIMTGADKLGGKNAERELAAVDAVLARRPAVANANTRYDAIEMAFFEAGKVARLEFELKGAESMRNQHFTELQRARTIIAQCGDVELLKSKLATAEDRALRAERSRDEQYENFQKLKRMIDDLAKMI